MKTHWPIHPLAALFPDKSREELDKLKHSMVQRLENGLDPLESSILLMEEKIVDGRHRDVAWLELADEGTCGGYFKRNLPPFETLPSGKEGLLTAWLRIDDRNANTKQMTQGQRAAVYLDAVELYPELKSVIDETTLENARRQKEGKPLDAGAQRLHTVEQEAKMAGVGPTTMKQAKRLKAKAPDKLKEVAAGRKSLKKALVEVEGGQPKKGKSTRKDGAGLRLDLRSSFKPYVAINDIAAMLERKTATMKVILTVTVADQDGKFLGEGSFKELVGMEWEGGLDFQGGANAKAPDAPSPDQNGSAVLKIETAQQQTDSEGFF